MHGWDQTPHSGQSGDYGDVADAVAGVLRAAEEAAEKIRGDARTQALDIVERALRLFLMRRADAPAPLAERWVVIRGEREPAVEIADRDRLLDLLGDRPL